MDDQWKQDSPEHNIESHSKGSEIKVFFLLLKLPKTYFRITGFCVYNDEKTNLRITLKSGKGEGV
jgi:hypothetical protein